jgi:hypothetical protein
VKNVNVTCFKEIVLVNNAKDLVLAVFGRTIKQIEIPWPDRGSKYAH